MSTSSQSSSFFAVLKGTVASRRAAYKVIQKRHGHPIMRFRHAGCCVGDGGHGPIFIVVYLKPGELAKPIVVLDVKGLCVGRAVDRRAQHLGFIVLAQSVPGVDETIAGIYLEKALVPLVGLARQTLIQDGVAGPEHGAVLILDSGIPALNYYERPETRSKLHAHGIEQVMKIGARRTPENQPVRACPPRPDSPRSITRRTEPIVRADDE